MLLCQLCLRSWQLLALRKTDWDSEKGVLYVLNEGNERVAMTLKQEETDLLDRYQENHSTETFLFEGNIPGKPFDRGSLHKAVKEEAKRAGITKRIYPDLLHLINLNHLLQCG